MYHRWKNTSRLQFQEGGGGCLQCFGGRHPPLWIMWGSGPSCFLCSWHLPGATHPSRPCTCATSCCMVRKEGGVGAHHGGDHGGALQLQLLKGRDWALRAVSADGSRQARRLVTFVERGHTKAITCCLPKWLGHKNSGRETARDRWALNNFFPPWYNAGWGSHHPERGALIRHAGITPNRWIKQNNTNALTKCTPLKKCGWKSGDLQTSKMRGKMTIVFFDNKNKKLTNTMISNCNCFFVSFFFHHFGGHCGIFEPTWYSPNRVLARRIWTH